VELSVIPLTLDRPTHDFTQQPAMDEWDMVAAFAEGFAAVPTACCVLCLGEMGIGNTTSAAALAGALFEGDAAEWTGRGTGVDDDALSRKRQVVQTAITRHRSAATDPLDLLRRLGGRELAAIAGAVVAARLRRVPVLLDGYVATAAAAPLEAFRPGALDHCRVAHVSAEPGHRRLIERLGQQALLSLDMRLGEASGAVLAMALLRAAVACHTGMRTFQQAGVSGPAECA
jgi:nicotinate-nucleotide--dimethylbenzimidazole phosphoribosyltransferase